MRRARPETVLSFASLVVALAALGFSVVAWQRPLPVDPRAIPSFGSGKEAKVLNAGASGRALFEFLEENEGRLVRIIAELDGIPVTPDPSNPLSGVNMMLPGPDCPANIPIPEEPTGDDTALCNWLLLEVSPPAEGSPALFYDSGGWYLEGYFANNGYIGTGAAVDEYRIYAISLVDAIT